MLQHYDTNLISLSNLRLIFSLVSYFHFSIPFELQKDIQFKVHSKYQLFETNLAPTQSNGLDLLATASAYGLIITGHPLSPELQSEFRSITTNVEIK